MTVFRREINGIELNWIELPHSMREIKEEVSVRAWLKYSSIYGFQLGMMSVFFSLLYVMEFEKE